MLEISQNFILTQENTHFKENGHNTWKKNKCQFKLTPGKHGLKYWYQQVH